MKKLSNIYLYLLVVIAAIGLSSCTTRDENPVPDPTTASREGYIKIFFDLPEFSRPQASRAMSDAAEKAIDRDLLNIAVFKVAPDGTETFAYIAPIQGAITVDANYQAMVVVKLVKSASPSDQYRIVVLANQDLSGVSMTPGSSTKAQIFSQLVYPYAAEWNAKPFPMWGESSVLTVSETMPSETIALYRAVARIDVGLNFTLSGGKLAEDAAGVDGFKLQEVLVYRTYDAGFAAPLSVDFKTVPSVPSSASVRADDNPLRYQATAPGDSYVREIYVPEASLAASPANANVHCVVVGGYYEGSSAMSYYRLDFATESAGVRTYMPILRNHRYVFNILKVNGPGFDSPEQALTSVPSIVDGVGYDLIVWDQTIHEMKVSGKYYFGLDQRDLLLEHTASADDPANVKRIKYQTNYPFSAGDPLALKWALGGDNPRFRAEWDENSREIAIYTETLNTTNTVLVDTLIVGTDALKMKVTVRQKYLNLRYTVNCETVEVSGTYVRGQALGTDHFITLTITAEDRSIAGQPYVVETQDPNGYGISFRASGKFNFDPITPGQPLTVTLKLDGSGTLNSPVGVESFILPIVSNSSSGSSCQATFWPLNPALNIVDFSSTDWYGGRRISDENTGVGKVVNAPSNFGPNDNSIVKTAKFNYVLASSSPSGTMANNKWITGLDGGKPVPIADIVYIAYSASPDDNMAKALVSYMDKGGIVVMFSENEGNNPYILNALFNTTNINVANLGGTYGRVYPFPAHEEMKLSEEALEATLREYEGDPILNGPFGDVRDKQWGGDGGYEDGISNLPLPHPAVTVYSTGKNINGSGDDNTRITMFKYESEQRNMFWCGDGGFMTADDGKRGTDQDTRPFWWDLSTFFPVPHTSYGYSSTNQYDVYNSTVFCNVWAWAVDRAEHLRAKREGTHP